MTQTGRVNSVAPSSRYARAKPQRRGRWFLFLRLISPTLSWPFLPVTFSLTPRHTCPSDSVRTDHSDTESESLSCLCDSSWVKTPYDSYGLYTLSWYGQLWVCLSSITLLLPHMGIVFLPQVQPCCHQHSLLLLGHLSLLSSAALSLLNCSRYMILHHEDFHTDPSVFWTSMQALTTPHSHTGM